MTNSSAFLIPGNVVQVRSWPEIKSTLDENGTLDGLPFMPEMLEYCGKVLTVTQRLERTCNETDGSMRRICNTVFLGTLRCPGSMHGGCQKECFIFWKEAWLQKVAGPVDTEETGYGHVDDQYSYKYKLPDGQYICQSTELFKASTPLSPFDIGCYTRDVRAKTYTPGRLLRVLLYAAFLRIQALVSGRSYRVLEGKQSKTPTASLHLIPGEFVRVKSRDRVAASLDIHGKNRGLAFTVEMLPFCGKSFRVLKRLERMIQEPTRMLTHLDDTVILENVICDGCHILRGGCARANYHYWREIWLERV